MSRHAVVDQLTAELAERRRTGKDRRAAYLALAQAILTDDPDDLAHTPASYGYASQQVRSAVAA